MWLKRQLWMVSSWASSPQPHLCSAVKQMAQCSCPQPEFPQGWRMEIKQVPLRARLSLGFAPNLVCTRHRPFLAYTLFFLSTSRYSFPRPKSRIENTVVSYSYPVKEIKPNVPVVFKRTQLSEDTARIFSVGTFYCCKQNRSLKIKSHVILKH